MTPEEAIDWLREIGAYGVTDLHERGMTTRFSFEINGCKYGLSIAMSPHEIQYAQFDIAGKRLALQVHKFRLFRKGAIPV